MSQPGGRRRKRRNCTITNLVHVTRKDGRVVQVSKELVISGPMTLAINGEVIGTTSEVRVDRIAWSAQDSDGDALPESARGA